MNKNIMSVMIVCLLINQKNSISQDENIDYRVKIIPAIKIFYVLENRDENSSTIGSFRDGDLVTILEKENEWIKIRLNNGKIGWAEFQFSGKEWKKDHLVNWKCELNPEDTKTITQNNEGLIARIDDLENRVLIIENIIKQQNQDTRSTNSNITKEPSQEDISNAIENLLKENVPVSWSGSMMGGNNAKIYEIQVQIIGNYNERMNYWPIKARVHGACDANLLTRIEKHEFNKVGDFKIYQNDYGKWVAEIEIMQ